MFTPAERQAFAPPEDLLPSQWAERHRYLPVDAAEGGGLFRNDRVPYAAGIMDAIVEPGVQEIVILKAAQVIYSTILGNILGWIVSQQPSRTLWIMPSKPEAKKLVDEVLRPLIKQCDALHSHLPGKRDDITEDGVKFDNMLLHVGEATVAQSLAARAIRFCILDEVDKYPATTGKEGSPIALARKRGSTFGHRRRLIMGCTPTTPDGHISIAWAGCGDRRHYHVPCPGCGTYQKLVFGQLRFDFEDVRAITNSARRADYVESHGRALYECVECKRLIATAERHQMLRAGRWVSEGQTVDKDGTVRGERPRSTRVGFHISCLYSPWVSFGETAAQFIRAKGNRAMMREFKNQWLAETFDEVVQQVTVEALRSDLAKIKLPPAGIVPQWAGKLTAGADVQGDRIYYVVRAWGRDRSQLVTFNECHTFDDLRSMCLNAHFPIEGSPGESLPVTMLFCDSGHRTNEVYNFAASDGRVKAVKGAPSYTPSSLLSWSPAAKELGIMLGIVDTQYFKEVLHADRQSGAWMWNDAVTDEYIRHIAAEVKRLIKGDLVWAPWSESTPNHFLDCEVYARAAAYYQQTHLLPDEASLVLQRKYERFERERLAAAVQTRQPVGVGVAGDQPDDWLGGRADGDWFRSR